MAKTTVPKTRIRHGKRFTRHGVYKSLAIAQKQAIKLSDADYIVDIERFYNYNSRTSTASQGYILWKRKR